LTDHFLNQTFWLRTDARLSWNDENGAPFQHILMGYRALFWSQSASFQ